VSLMAALKMSQKMMKNGCGGCSSACECCTEAGGREFHVYYSDVFSERCGTQLGHSVAASLLLATSTIGLLVRNSCGPVQAAQIPVCVQKITISSSCPDPCVRA
jgi:transcription elongation factor Elf1